MRKIAQLRSFLPASGQTIRVARLLSAVDSLRISMGLITGLDHVNLVIDAGDDALSRARAFYQELLGLIPLERPANTDSGNPGAWYQCGVQQLHPTTEKRRVGGQPQLAPPSAFRVASLAALRQRLESAGIEIIAGDRFPGQERFFVRDPWGNRLEFVERT